MENKNVPVVTLAGFLGSGKTTLLRNILEDAENPIRIAVIRNDFSNSNDEEPVECPLLVSEDHSDIFSQFWEYPNSCICCSVRSQFVQGASRLVEISLAEGKPFELVVVEISGLADPISVSNSLLDFEGDSSIRFGGIITVVDSSNFLQWKSAELTTDDRGRAGELTSGDHGRGLAMIVKTQLAAADLVIMNKMDLLKDVTADQVEQEVRSYNSQADIIRTKYSKVDVRKVLQVASLESRMRLESRGNFCPESLTNVAREKWTIAGRFNPDAMEQYLNELLWTGRLVLYRGKGLFRGLDGRWNDLQVVGDSVKIGPVEGRFTSDSLCGSFLFIAAEIGHLHLLRSKCILKSRFPISPTNSVHHQTSESVLDGTGEQPP